jgi:raffinose/stachyose/melibiose transport system permease protein
MTTKNIQRTAYPYRLFAPAAVIYVLIFVVPTAISFFFAFTRWDLVDWNWIGFENFRQFFREQSLNIGLRNTLIYAVVTSGTKVILGMALAVLLTSRLRSRGFLRSVIFFPVLVSTVAVGLTFSVLMHPSTGLINRTLSVIGIHGPRWLTNPQLALLSVALVDVWKGIGLATLIYIAGIASIPPDYYEAVDADGGNGWHRFRHVTLPLSRAATFNVITLSFIGGLRSFDLIWTMTNGGPGFKSDVLASVIFKQYQSGFYGLATAGNVVFFIFVLFLVLPLNRYFRKKELVL